MAKEQFDEMIEVIRQAATESRMNNEVEGDIWKRFLRIERLNLQGYVDLRGTADFGPALEYKGQVLKRLAGHWLGRIRVPYANNLLL